MAGRIDEQNKIKVELIDLRKKIMELSEEELLERNVYLKGLLTKEIDGELIKEIEGPLTGYASIDKPWLAQHAEEGIRIKSPKKTAYREVKDSNQNNLDGTAINFYGFKTTYKELFEEIDKAAASFKKLGIKEGDYVTFCMPALPQTTFAFYALNKIGAVANFVDLRTNKENIRNHINNTDSKVLITFHDTLEKCEEIFSSSNCHTIVDVKVSDSLPTRLKVLSNLKNKSYKEKHLKTTISWGEFLKLGKNTKTREIPYQKDKPAGIVYTGGTTGEPKGAVLTNDNINNMKTQYLATGMDLQKNDIFMNIMPPFISYGFVMGLHFPIDFGFEDLLIPKFNPKEMGDLLEKYRPNFVIGIPSHFEFMMNDEKLKDADLSYIKISASGGDAMNPIKEKEISDFLLSHGAKTKIKIGYGMTENSSTTNTELNDETTKEGSTGFPLCKNVETIIDENGIEKRIASLRDINGVDHYDNKGELIINSPTMVKGYYNREDEDKKAFVFDITGQRWIKSGDNAKIDEDGRVWIIGRNKDMFIRPDGHNVWPIIIENVINQSPIVEDSCVVGLKSIHNDAGEIPTAFVVLRDKSYDKKKAAEEIKEYQSHILPERDGAIDIRFIDELPLTSVGKVDKNKLKTEGGVSEIDFDTLIGQKKEKTKIKVMKR